MATDAGAPAGFVITNANCTTTGLAMGLAPLRQFGLEHEHSAGRVDEHEVDVGGEVVRAPRVMHGKRSKVFHDERGLFAGVANPFWAARYHSLVIEPSSLPASLQVSAKTWEDEIMAVRAVGDHGSAPLCGLQFHPESIATDAGRQILQNFIAMSED